MGLFDTSAVVSPMILLSHGPNGLHTRRLFAEPGAPGAPRAPGELGASLKATSSRSSRTEPYGVSQPFCLNKIDLKSHFLRETHVVPMDSGHPLLLPWPSPPFAFGALHTAAAEPWRGAASPRSRSSARRCPPKATGAPRWRSWWRKPPTSAAVHKSLKGSG